MVRVQNVAHWLINSTLGLQISAFIHAKGILWMLRELLERGAMKLYLL